MSALDARAQRESVICGLDSSTELPRHASKDLINVGEGAYRECRDSRGNECKYMIMIDDNRICTYSNIPCKP